jgi:histidinol-phosphate/aromatic aminotransferase/cobyric acid decarboxylase-like protein
VAAAIASLKDAQVVAERKQVNTMVRQQTFDWLKQQGYSFVPSESNCFMLDTKRPAKEVIEAMSAHNVFIGRVFPAWPTHVRITVGTRAEMTEFQAAFQKVMTNATSAGYLPVRRLRVRSEDGQLRPMTDGDYS